MIGSVCEMPKQAKTDGTLFCIIWIWVCAGRYYIVKIPPSRKARPPQWQWKWNDILQSAALGAMQATVRDKVELMILHLPHETVGADHQAAMKQSWITRGHQQFQFTESVAENHSLSLRWMIIGPQLGPFLGMEFFEGNGVFTVKCIWK